MKIKDTFQTHLLENLIDVLVIGGVSAPTMCKPISKMLIPEILNDANAIPTPDRTTSALSIARCGVLLNAFDLNVFKHDFPSPGEENPCTGDKMIVDDTSVESEANQYCSNVQLDAEDYAQTLGQAIEESVSNPDENCPPEDVIPSDAAVLDIEVAVATEKKDQMYNQYHGDRNLDDMETNDLDAVWNEVSLSDTDIQKMLNGPLHTLMPTEYQLKKANKWMEFLEDQHHGWNSRYRCRICHTYAKVYHAKEKKMPEVAYSAGVINYKKPN